VKERTRGQPIRKNKKKRERINMVEKPKAGRKNVE